MLNLGRTARSGADAALLINWRIIRAYHVTVHPPDGSLLVINDFETMIRADQLAADQEQAKLTAAAAQKAAMGNTADAFETDVGGLVATLSSAATELRATAQSMSATALRTNGQAAKVAGATEGASAGIQMVAAAAEELTASISEISRQVSQSSKISRQAVVDARRTNDNCANAVARRGENRACHRPDHQHCVTDQPFWR